MIYFKHILNLRIRNILSLLNNSDMFYCFKNGHIYLNLNHEH